MTDDAHTKAAPLADATREAVAREIVPRVAEGRVPVLGGFVGATLQGVTTTLGRGGSDYSAAIIGAALDAREIQIWTDVDGMMTADPRIVAGPRVVPHLSFGEASELAYFGAKVLHPSTILPAVAKDIPVRILNSRRADGSGTRITADPPAADRALAAVACKRHVTMVEITSTRMLMAHGFLRRVFEVFERHRTAVDVVTTSEVSVSVTVDDDARLDGDRARTCASSPRSTSRPTSRFCAPSATICATIRASRRASSGRSRGSRCAWSRRPRRGATSRSCCATRICDGHGAAAPGVFRAGCRPWRQLGAVRSSAMQTIATCAC